jgi:hypothetical protein
MVPNTKMHSHPTMAFFLNFLTTLRRQDLSQLRQVTLTAQTGMLEYVTNIKNVMTNKKCTKVTRSEEFSTISFLKKKNGRAEIVRGDTEDTADVLEAFDGGQGSCLGFTCLNDQLLQTQCIGRNFIFSFLFFSSSVINK